MSAMRRLIWLRSFQFKYRTGGWFNAIEEVLRFADNERLFARNRTWFSLVDAHILAAVQDGKRRQKEYRPLVAANPGSSRWERFFRTLDSRSERPSQLRALWGTAEQSATDYGVARSSGRHSSFAERTIKNITDIWRSQVRNANFIPRAFRAADNHYCNTLWQLPMFCKDRSWERIARGFIRPTWFDPREREFVRTMAPILWNASNAFNDLGKFLNT